MCRVRRVKFLRREYHSRHGRCAHYSENQLRPSKADVLMADVMINAIDAALENRKNSFRRCSVALRREHILRLRG